MDRGIKYIALNLEYIKLFIFINGSFANNKDFSSQIGYLIILVNETDISILFGCQDPGGLLTGFDFPDRPDGLLAGSWQDFNFPDRPDRPGRLLAGS